jgi:general secretion pathway protein G
MVKQLFRWSNSRPQPVAESRVASHASRFTIRYPRFTIRHSLFAIRPSQAGFTFVELIVVTTILLILASAAMPLAKVTMQRQREAELRRALREMRTAIDKFKDAVDLGQIGSVDVKAGSEGYPPDLETLVEGVSVANDASGKKLKFLRKIPIDPMTNSTEWGMRSYQDRPESTSWGGQNVYDVFTKSDGKALDGTKYKDW